MKTRAKEPRPEHVPHGTPAQRHTRANETESLVVPPEGARTAAIAQLQELADRSTRVTRHAGPVRPTKTAPEAAGIPQQHPVQRLVVTGDDQDNLVIASALPIATAQSGGPVQDWADANLTGQHHVAIVAHGDTSEITLDGVDHDGAELAAGLVERHIEPGSTLWLWACRAGMRAMEDGQSIEGSSLVEQTAAGLTGEVAGVSVSGFRGIHMVLPGDENASRIVDLDLTDENPETELEWHEALAALNQHYVCLSDYFSERYRAMYMPGWQQQQVQMPFGHERTLWSIDEDVFDEHDSEQTQAEFFEKERLAHPPPLVAPAWLANQAAFNEYKDNLLRAAGMNLVADADYDLATVRDSPATHAAITRTAVSAAE